MGVGPIVTTGRVINADLGCIDLHAKHNPGKIFLPIVFPTASSSTTPLITLIAIAL